jgi:hypothetical protein
MALFAGDIKLNDKLRDPLAAINKSSQDKLTAALGTIGTRQKTSNMASGRVMGEYAPAELARAGTQASTSIEDQLLGALGGTSYSEHLKEQEHQRDLALAKEIGSLNAPSTLQQVLGGLGGVANVAGQFGSLYKGLSKRPTTARPDLSFNDFYNSGVA